MKFNRFFNIGLLFSISLVSSCSNDNKSEMETIIDDMQIAEGFVKDIVVTGENIIPENVLTRTAYEISSSLSFSWASGDVIGIYPIGGTQVDFPISSGEGSKTASFDGGAWALRANRSYAAYYPFSKQNFFVDETQIPVDYTGQTQDGNGSLAHLGQYDFMAAAATTPNENGGVDLAMRHLGSFIKIQLTIPVADTFTSVTLSNDAEKEFTTKATFDLSAETPALTATETASTYTIALNNVTTTNRNEVVTIYAFIAPIDLSGDKLTITLAGTKNQTYIATVDGKEMKARGGYVYTATIKNGTDANGNNITFPLYKNGIEYVDLGLTTKVDGKYVPIYWADANLGGTYTDYSRSYYSQYSPSQRRLLHYAWGDYRGYYTEHDFIRRDAPFYSYSQGEWTRYKYDSNERVLLPEHDSATRDWGSPWRMPTKEDFENLVNNSIITFDQPYFTFTSKINGNSISFQACGYIDGQSLLLGNSYALYWSSTRGSSWARCYFLSCYMNKDSQLRVRVDQYNYNTWDQKDDHLNREHGLCIRPVFVDDEQ